MKKALFICLLLAAAFSMQSCSTHRTAINDLEALVNKVEKNGAKYTLEDWENVIYRCAKIEKKLQKHEYSAEEHREIGTLKGRLAGVVTKDILTNSAKKVISIKEQLDGGTEGFLEGLLK
ncbi:MAG: hypothetical protein IKL56_00690 [Bacteroidaceae bacterium]|nr:hypothetical protein [Bacteroidaceae bacterium]